MTIASSLHTVLTGNAAVSALVANRVYAMVIPQHNDVFPALTYSQETGEFIEHLEGRSDTRLAEFSIDCWAKRYGETKTLAETVIAELVGFRGAFGANTAESVRLENDFDVPPEPDTELYRNSLRFVIAYQ